MRAEPLSTYRKVVFILVGVLLVLYIGWIAMVIHDHRLYAPVGTVPHETPNLSHAITAAYAQRFKAAGITSIQYVDGGTAYDGGEFSIEAGTRSTHYTTFPSSPCHASFKAVAGTTHDAADIKVSTDVDKETYSYGAALDCINDGIGRALFHVANQEAVKASWVAPASSSEPAADTPVNPFWRIFRGQ